MGRPKGSKNKSKVLEYPVDARPLPKIKDTSTPLSKVSQKSVERGLKQASEGKLEDLAPLLEDEIIQDPNEVIIHDAVTEDSEPAEKGLKRPTKNLKHVIEKVDFLMEEVKNLRAYIKRIEDAFIFQNGKEALPEGSDLVSPVKRRKRQT
jgi:predicted transcriptional regulator